MNYDNFAHNQLALVELQSELSETQFTYLCNLLHSCSINCDSSAASVADTEISCSSSVSAKTFQSMNSTTVPFPVASNFKSQSTCLVKNPSEGKNIRSKGTTNTKVKAYLVKEQAEFLDESLKLAELEFDKFQKTKLSSRKMMFQGMEIEIGSRSSSLRKSNTSTKSAKSTTTTFSKMSCKDLPACRRIMGKYPRIQERSSSTETLKADSLDDEENPLEKIAGKIANEPVNPFPPLKLPAGNSNLKGFKQKPLNPLDGVRVEQEIDRMIRSNFQDYKDVTEFFRGQNKSKTTKGQFEPRKKIKGAYDLSRRVTNPLYKEYDPAGYRKTDDELAMECIQKICNDFNQWINTLTTEKKNVATATATEIDHHHDQDKKGEIEIGPEFLVKILRRDLELPEKYLQLIK